MVILHDRVLEVYYAVLVPWIYYIPGMLLVSSGSARHYGLEQMVEPVLPYVGEIHFASLAQGINQEVNLIEVERIVVDGLTGISYDGIEFGTRVFVFIIKLLIAGHSLVVTVWVEILLKKISVIEVSVVLKIHHSLVAFVTLHELGIIPLRLGVGHLGFDTLEIGCPLWNEGGQFTRLKCPER